MNMSNISPYSYTPPDKRTNGYTEPQGTLTAKHVPSIKATGVRFIRFVTSPTAQMLGILVREYSST